MGNLPVKRCQCPKCGTIVHTQAQNLFSHCGERWNVSDYLIPNSVRAEAGTEGGMSVLPPNVPPSIPPQVPVTTPPVGQPITETDIKRINQIEQRLDELGKAEFEDVNAPPASKEVLLETPSAIPNTEVPPEPEQFISICSSCRAENKEDATSCINCGEGFYAEPK